MVDIPTSLETEDFYKLDVVPELKKKYFDEVAAHVKAQLKCDKVVCMHHMVRNPTRDGFGGYANGAPHTDSSAVSGDALALDMMMNPDQVTGKVCDDEKEEGVPKYKRYLYLNLWRNISKTPIQNNHLAMLDERTVVKPDDYIPKDLFGDGYSTVQYSLNARHKDAHRWWYFPKMTKNEGILFKQIDSDWTKSGRVCFHMSVADPKLEDANLPTRESIELRMFCFWKDAEVDSMPTAENLNLKLVKDPVKLAANGGAALEEATVWEIGKSMVNRMFGWGSSTTTSDYSGKPEDYKQKFVDSVNYFESWPEAGRTWALNHMKDDKGYVTVIKTLVDDSTGHFGTKAFDPAQKKEVVDFLLADEDYVNLCKKKMTKKQ